MSCLQIREEAAVALLGHQGLPEIVTEHLDRCPACRDEIEGLAALPVLLGIAREIAAGQQSPAPAGQQSPAPAGQQSPAPAGQQQPAPAGPQQQPTPAGHPGPVPDPRVPVSGLVADELGAALRVDPDPAPAMLERLLVEVSGRRQRRRLVIFAAAAATLVAIALPVGLLIAEDGGARPRVIAGAPTGSASPGTSSSTGSTPPRTSSPAQSPGTTPATSAPLASGAATNPATGVRAEIAVMAAAWGSQINVQAYHVRAGTRCRLVVVDRAGHREFAGSWTATARYESASVTETVATDPDQIRHVLLINAATGKTLVSVPVA